MVLLYQIITENATLNGYIYTLNNKVKLVIEKTWKEFGNVPC